MGRLVANSTHYTHWPLCSRWSCNNQINGLAIISKTVWSSALKTWNFKTFFSLSLFLSPITLITDSHGPILTSQSVSMIQANPVFYQNRSFSKFCKDLQMCRPQDTFSGLHILVSAADNKPPSLEFTDQQFKFQSHQFTKKEASQCSQSAWTPVVATYHFENILYEFTCHSYLICISHEKQVINGYG